MLVTMRGLQASCLWPPTVFPSIRTHATIRNQTISTPCPKTISHSSDMVIFTSKTRLSATSRETFPSGFVKRLEGQIEYSSSRRVHSTLSRKLQMPFLSNKQKRTPLYSVMASSKLKYVRQTPVRRFEMPCTF